MSNYPKRKPKLNEYDLTGEYGIGYTSKGYEFYFDLEDYDKIKDYTWCRDGDVLRTTTNGVDYKMHRLVMNCPDGLVVDHRNHDKRDNRKENLRICTDKENKHNRTPSNKRCCGVSFKKDRNKWYARIADRFLGYFDTEEEAIIARQRAEIEEFGEFSYTLSMERSKNYERKDVDSGDRATP